MIKWVMGVLGTVVAGVLVYWLTIGIHTPTPPIVEPPPGTIHQPPGGPPDEIAGRIEELQRHLENNENEQERTRRGIEHLRTMLETDPDAWRAIQEHERILERLTMERERMEHELGRLHE